MPQEEDKGRRKDHHGRKGSRKRLEMLASSGGARAAAANQKFHDADRGVAIGREVRRRVFAGRLFHFLLFPPPGLDFSDCAKPDASILGLLAAILPSSPTMTMARSHVSTVRVVAAVFEAALKVRGPDMPTEMGAFAPRVVEELGRDPARYGRIRPGYWAVQLLIQTFLDARRKFLETRTDGMDFADAPGTYHAFYTTDRASLGNGAAKARGRMDRLRPILLGYLDAWSNPGTESVSFLVQNEDGDYVFGMGDDGEITMHADAEDDLDGSEDCMDIDGEAAVDGVVANPSIKRVSVLAKRFSRLTI